MPSKWKTLDVKAIAKKAAEKTDDNLASKISSVTRLTDEEVKKMFPDKGDVALFAELMNIVNSADGKNQKINQITANAEKFGKVLLTLLSKLV